MSRFKNMAYQTFRVEAYKTQGLNKWQHQYKFGAGVWVFVTEISARSPHEACRRIRQSRKGYQRFKGYRFRATPSFERSEEL